MGAKWTTVSSLKNYFDPTYVCFEPSTINNELVLCSVNQPGMFSKNTKGMVMIHKYDSKKNKWIKCFELRRIIGAFDAGPFIALDKVSNILYVLTPNDKKLIKYNMETTKITKTLIDVSNTYLPGCNYSKSFIINGTFNMIGGTSNHRHYMFNEHTSQIETVFAWNGRNALCDFGLIHIKSKNCVLLLGGTGNSGSKYHDCGEKFIYSYSINTKKWIKLDTSLPIKMYGFGYIINEIETHILIFGGKRRTPRNLDLIYILNLSTMKFFKSKIKCPRAGPCIVGKSKEYTSNCDILICGYVRFKIKNKSPPNDVLRIIGSYYDGIEFVHFINKTSLHVKTQKHWKIPLYALLENAKPIKGS